MTTTAIVVEELQALQAHFSRQTRGTEDEHRWLRDYVDDLNGLSDDAVRYACRRWRQSGARKYPTSGELLTLAREHHEPDRAVGGSDNGAWQPITESEYAALSLQAKIRHHTILGMREQVKAGPQYRHGKPIPPEEMPAAWQEARARARHHFDEAARLRAYLTRPEPVYREDVA